MSRSFTIDVEYDHPPHRVWRALTDRDAIASWLMDNDFEARVGHSFTLRTEPGPGFDGVVRCEVIELEPPGDGGEAARMAWSWRGGPIDTVVTFELRPTERGTRLRVTQSGFTGVKGALIRMILRGGSRKIYRRKLAAVLDQFARDDAGTVHAIRNVDANDHPRACARKGFWRWFAAATSPILKRRGQAKEPHTR